MSAWVKVVVSEHAFARWPQRGGWRAKRTKLARMMTTKVRNALQRGMKIDPTGAGWVQIDRHLWAVVRPAQHGGWVVTTFILRR